jgi:integrase
MRWQDIDFQRKIISVSQSLSHDGQSFTSPKTSNSVRTITIDDTTIEALKSHQELIEAEKAIDSTLYQDNDLVAPTSSGKPCNPRSLYTLFTTLKNKAGMRHITFHDLRHTTLPFC